MSDLAKMSRETLAAYIAEHLRSAGIDVVLTGGSCVSIYSNERYVSKDLDFIDISLRSNREIGRVLREIGFHNEPKNSRHFAHPDTEWTLEFPSPPLIIGDEIVEKKAIAERKTAEGSLRLLSPTDCVKDRLANFYYFNDRQCYEQALFVARAQVINWAALEKWHVIEQQLEAYKSFRIALSSSDS